MTKQELIEQINELRTCKGWSDKHPDATDVVPKEDVLKLVEQLSEPEKVVVPKFVAEWLKVHDWKEETEGQQSLFDLYSNLLGDYKGGYHKEVKYWVDQNGNTLARAWLDGYEIEPEKLYIVEIPDPNNKGWKHTTLVRKLDGTIRIMMIDNDKWINSKEHQLTEAEIKKEFEWAWDAGFAKEVEILYERT